jgi:amino acid adenylation domain-containing protein
MEELASLSFEQQHIWLLDQLVPNAPAYNRCVTVSLPGQLDVASLETGLSEIVRRHEAWRTSFPIVDGQPVQLVHPPAPMSVLKLDVRDLPTFAREAAVIGLVTEAARRPFDLATGPLVSATLAQLGDTEHRLYLTLHQAICDPVRLSQVFLPELRALYEAFTTGTPSPLPELPIQYSDYALWQREHLREDTLADQLAYWKRQLAGAPAHLALPADHSSPPVRTARGAVLRFELSQELTAGLASLSQQEGVTLFVTLLAAFSILLRRYTDQEDILVGTSVTNRMCPETRDLLGCFLNTVVLRTDLSGTPTFRELLGRTREVTASAMAHAGAPFPLVIRELRPGRSSFFQVMLTLEPPPPILSSGWRLSHGGIATGAAHVDLSLELEEQPEGLVGQFEYSTDLFDALTIARMAGHWQTLLESLVADPEQNIFEAPLLNECERHQLLVEWNATQAKYSSDQCLHQLFEAQVERTPDAVAVVCREQHLTYAELNRRANQLAHRLRRLGVGPDVLVGLCLERSLEMVVGLLGILKAGGAYVPLDPTYPPERLAFMLADSHASVLITQERLTTRLRDYSIQVICLDRPDGELLDASTDDLVSEVRPDNIVYVIYTSGSTGRPKGVQVLHRGVVNFVTAMRREPGLSKEDTLLSVTTLCFDIAALELFVPLIVGARVIVVTHEVAANGQELADALDRSRATVMQATPATWRLLLAAGWRGSPQLKILCGGEALSVELAKQLLPKCATLWNMYGPTETTIWSTICKVETEGWISIGRPIANTQVYVLDARLQPVPVGVPGELYIGGDGLARGYLNRPELTAEKFIPHPFSSIPEARLYKTGDLVRYRPNGALECLGRLDHQVKVRGFRIELGEVEAVLQTHPMIAAAVVVAREDAPGDKRLVAYLVAHAGQEFAAAEVRRFLKAHLPDYMIPTALVPLEALPLTPNGKVDRQVLPAPTRVYETSRGDATEATLPIHRQLIQIWEELLDVRPIRVTDDFFDLGGHSLLAARLVERIEQAFGKKIPLTTFHAGATIESLAQVIGQQSDTAARPPLVKYQEVSAKSPFFFLHGDYRGGDPLWCLNLARALSPDQPLHLLQPGLLNDRLAPTLESFAAAHVAIVRSLQPEGPYFLGGWCNGALVAYEMAHQLYAQGQTVGLLALMETAFVNPLERRIRTLVGSVGDLVGLGQGKQLDWYIRTLRVSNYALRALRSAFYRLPRGNVGYLARLGSAELRRGVSLARPLVQRSRQGGYVGDALGRPREDYLDVFSWMAANYVPRPYPGQVTLFWSQEDLLYGPSRKMGWRIAAKAARMALHRIPGDHLTCRTEHVHVLAEHLKECLIQAQATGQDRRQ